MKSMSLSLAVVLILTVATIDPVKGVDCVKTKLPLAPCLPFITGNVKSPATVCCNALSGLKASAPTKPEIRVACDCFVTATKNFPNLDKDKAIELLQLCNVDLGFPIIKDLDCSK